MRAKWRARARAWSRKSELHSEKKRVPRRRGRAVGESLLGGRRRKLERVSGHKDSPRVSMSLAKHKIAKKVEDEGPVH